MTEVFSASCSINFWIKPLVGGGTNIFGSDYISITTSGTDLVFVYDTGGTLVNESGTSGFVQDIWSMVTVTCEKVNATTMRVRMYVDNVEINDSGDLTNVIMGDFSGGDLYIGALGSLSPNGFISADFDSFTFHQEVLSPGEISFLYNNTYGTEELYGCGWLGKK
jgi:hypothetical protein